MGVGALEPGQACFENNVLLPECLHDCRHAGDLYPQLGHLLRYRLKTEAGGHRRYHGSRGRTNGLILGGRLLLQGHLAEHGSHDLLDADRTLLVETAAASGVRLPVRTVVRTGRDIQSILLFYWLLTSITYVRYEFLF